MLVLTAIEIIEDGEDGTTLITGTVGDQLIAGAGDTTHSDGIMVGIAGDHLIRHGDGTPTVLALHTEISLLTMYIMATTGDGMEVITVDGMDITVVAIITNTPPMFITVRVKVVEA